MLIRQIVADVNIHQISSFWA